MRQDAWRRDAASYPLRGELQPRYTDVDVWQHLNNGALISMHGEAVQQKLRSVFGPAAWRQREPALACARNATDFLSEAHYPAPVQWGARVLGADASGLRVATALFQHGHCVGLHEATLTGWSGGQAAGLTPEHRAALQTARVPATELAEPDGETAGTPILADSGGGAKQMIAGGQVRVDGQAELRRGCKLRAGQVVELTGARIQVRAAAELPHSPIPEA